MRVGDSCYFRPKKMERGGWWDSMEKPQIYSPVMKGRGGEREAGQRLPNLPSLLFVILGRKVPNLILLEAGLSGVMP